MSIHLMSGQIRSDKVVDYINILYNVLSMFYQCFINILLINMMLIEAATV